MKDTKNLVNVFKVLQAAQVGLLIAQGLLLLGNRTNQFSLLIWSLLGLAAFLQLLLVSYFPKKIDMSEQVDRSAMVKLRLLAVVPYILIVLGIAYSR